VSERRPICAHCVYWKAEHISNQPTAGHCHRYPPGVFVNPSSGTVVQKFPMTERGQWCGEWNGDETAIVEAARNSALKHAREAASHSHHHASQTTRVGPAPAG
jgi:hypothetical protein